MTIIINLPLKFDIHMNSFVVEYNKYEEPTFDQFILSSLASNTNSNKVVGEKYIDKITGKGSLNEHFKKLYEKILTFNQKQLNDVLNNMQYPISVTDRSNKYKFNEELNISIFKGKVYEGNLGYFSEEELSKILDISNIVKIKTEEKEQEEERENYQVEFKDDEIFININKETSIPVTYDNFEDWVDTRLTIESEELDAYLLKDVNGGEWTALDDAKFNNMKNVREAFRNKQKEHCEIVNNKIKVTKIAMYKDIYIYCEEHRNYLNDIEMCEMVLSTILKNNSQDKYNQNLILDIIKKSGYSKAKEVLNKLLEKIKHGTLIDYAKEIIIKEKSAVGWNNDILQKFKTDRKVLPLIYATREEIDYTIEELLRIENITLDEKKILRDADIKKLEEYKKNREELIKTYQMIIGMVTSSGIREKRKILTSSDETREFTKLANKHIGHASDDIIDLPLEEIEKRITDAQRMQQLAIILEGRVAKQKNNKKK